MSSEVLGLRTTAVSTRCRTSYPGKLLLDYGVVLLIAPMALLLVLICACIIWRRSGRPLFYCQSRIGQHRKVFRIIKLRTMDERGAVTTEGALLRRYWFDELPQLLHIITRKMSIVGPRPYCEAEYHTWFALDARGYALRQEVKPGLLSRLALAGKAEDVAARLGEEVPLRWDLDYTQQQSLSTDLRLIWQAILQFLFILRK